LAVALVQGRTSLFEAAGHLKLATTPEERKHSTTPHPITLRQFPKTTGNQHRHYLTPRITPPLSHTHYTTPTA
jgi:hypothetical protein